MSSKSTKDDRKEEKGKGRKDDDASKKKEDVDEVEEEEEEEDDEDEGETDEGNFGHMGFTPGDWWKNWKAAQKDGIHAMSGAGIWGRKKEGAFSIIVNSRTNTKVDKDDGETLWYGDHTPTKRNLLSVNKKSGKLVRVIRGSKGYKPESPSDGLRYDGLYKVVGEKTNREVDRKSTYQQYKLVRADEDVNKGFTLDACKKKCIEKIEKQGKGDGGDDDDDDGDEDEDDGKDGNEE